MRERAPKILRGPVPRNKEDDQVVYIDGDYSMLVLDKRGRMVFYAANSADFSNAQNLQNQKDAVQEERATLSYLRTGPRAESVHRWSPQKLTGVRRAKGRTKSDLMWMES